MPTFRDAPIKNAAADRTTRPSDVVRVTRPEPSPTARPDHPLRIVRSDLFLDPKPTAVAKAKAPKTPAKASTAIAAEASATRMWAPGVGLTGRSAPAPVPKPHVVRKVGGRTLRRGAMMLAKWTLAHRALAALIAVALTVPVVVLAVLTIRQDAVVTPAAQAPDVVFQAGADYAAINAAGFATVTPSANGATATISLAGIPGATSTLLAKVAKITNTDVTAANDYAITLTRSADPDAAIVDLIVTVANGGTTIVTWDAADTASSAAFVIPANTALDVSIQIVITAGTAVQTFAAFTISMDLTTNP